MRTYGRTTDEYGNKTWHEVDTAPDGSNDYVYITTLIQNLLLILGESPFYGNRGIPAQTSILTQVMPDFYVTLTQQFFAPFFASLIVAKQPQAFNDPTPIYNINVLTNAGTKINKVIPE